MFNIRKFWGTTRSQAQSLPLMRPNDEGEEDWNDDGQPENAAPLRGALLLGHLRRLVSSRGFTIFISFLLGFLLQRWVGQRPSITSCPAVPESSVTDPFLLGPLDEPRFPAVADYNKLQTKHTNVGNQSPVTPLFIPFARNNQMLMQALLSYIAAGWPRDQITIIDNSGTMDANLQGHLSENNPFYLDYNTLRGRYGVSILRTPSLLSFAQVQNYILSVAMSRGWQYFYWSHQDVAILGYEAKTPYVTVYDNLLSSLAKLLPHISPDSRKDSRWGGRHYAFDYLTLINVEAVRRVGTWDPFIPYYTTDCDFYERVRLSGFPITEERVGDIFDLAAHVPDPEKQFFPDYESGEEPRLNSTRYSALFNELGRLQTEKNQAPGGRNYWQHEQQGGEGEPWTYSIKGFEKAWWTFAQAGRDVFAEKWKTASCGVIGEGKTLADIWS